MPDELLDKLHRFRIEREMSYQVLAEDIGISRDHLIRLMTTRGIRAFDRTIGRLQRYIDRHNSDERRSA